MNKELLMDLISKDIEKSYQVLLSAQPNTRHKQFEEELDEIKQDFLNGDYEIIERSANYAVNSFLSKLETSIKNNESLEITEADLLLPFLIYTKLFAYLNTHEIDENFILMMYRDIDTAKNFATMTTMKVAAKEDKSDEMKAIAIKKHAVAKEKENIAKEIIAKIWRS
ncbi:MAG: hypothetical protein L6Q37_16285, partial [Bdellovibrionaceae bacterium]|nr:hypothetical protein [Pseudobdellovibrionaceae bacterium]